MGNIAQFATFICIFIIACLVAKSEFMFTDTGGKKKKNREKQMGKGEKQSDTQTIIIKRRLCVEIRFVFFFSLGLSD